MRMGKTSCERKGLLNKVLGLRPGNEHAAVNAKRQAVELGLAGDVLDGLAGEAPLNQRVVTHRSLGVEHFIGVGDEEGAVALDEMEQERFRIETRTLGMRPAAQALLAVGDPAFEGHATWLSAFSCSA